MSKGYDQVVVKFRGELADISLEKLQKEVGLQYKWLLKNDGPRSESVMNANANKRPWRKFKGTCNKCGLAGHRASDCPSKGESGTPNSGGRRDISTVTCHKCKQKGHYANKCPSKTAYTSPLSAMFVGWCSTIDDSTTTEGKISDGFFDDWCPDFGNTTRYDQEDTLDLPEEFITIGEAEEPKHDYIYATSQEDEMVMSGSMSHQDEE
jgi:hypothetical protein